MMVLCRASAHVSSRLMCAILSVFFPVYIVKVAAFLSIIFFVVVSIEVHTYFGLAPCYWHRSWHLSTCCLQVT